jgi:REP element-mobilizing transposase RayT
VGAITRKAGFRLAGLYRRPVPWLIRRDFCDHLKHVYRKPVFRSRSYCIISCGGAPLSIIKHDIEQQASPA